MGAAMSGRGAALLGTIGRTPLVPLAFPDLGVTVHAKCEFLNPSGSIKDRFARHVVLGAEARGLIGPDSILLECTSGNTGIALAMVGAARGYRVTILMSERASAERRHLIRQFGAELILFDAKGSYETGIDLAGRMAAGDSRYFLTRQFENPVNAEDHEETTAAEIVGQAPGPVAAFVAGYGTGGTLAGCGRGLRRAYPGVRVVAMEPAEAAMLLGECPCCHFIEGIAGGFVPPLLRGAPLDGEVKVASAEALAMTRRLNREFGLMVGTSSGGNVAAAVRVAREVGTSGSVVTLLCDRAERYFSTPLFGEPAPAAAGGAAR